MTEKEKEKKKKVRKKKDRRNATFTVYRKHISRLTQRASYDPARDIMCG